jgi:hypothetical protein
MQGSGVQKAPTVILHRIEEDESLSILWKAANPEL